MLFFSTYVKAYEHLIQIDISQCVEKSCFSVFQQTFNPSDDLKVIAWADITDTLDDGTPSFYPLFNIYNYKISAINVEIGMQLLDENHSVLSERVSNTKFSPYDESESQYKIYRSLFALDLSDEIINKTRFVNIIIRNK
ncbi:MAG: hypothetical protein COA83_02695 [Methylophaga sp.]|nr:MAG: hypothetical protein COA83_02695 [Methylophaga sp.]